MRSLLFLSSYGDFTIAIFVLKKYFLSAGHKNDLQLIASSHLQPLYQDLLKTDPELNQLPLRFEDFNIKHKILSVLTNIHFLKKHSITELQTLKSFVQSQVFDSTEWMVEQKRRSWLLSFVLGKKVTPVHGEGNVYDSFARLAAIPPEDLISSTHQHQFQENSLRQNSSDCAVLILPDSRMKSKALDQEMINKIAAITANSGMKATTAFFRTIPFVTKGEQTIHVQFIDLIRLIQSAYIIVTADSLPAHLAQYLDKPHIIVYAESTNDEWLTPYARANKTYCSFRKLDQQLDPILKKLQAI